MTYPHHDYITAVATALTDLGLTIDSHYADSPDDSSLEAAIDIDTDANQLTDQWRRAGARVALSWFAPGPESTLPWGWGIVVHGHNHHDLHDSDGLAPIASPHAVAAIAARHLTGRDLPIPDQDWAGARPLDNAIEAWLATHNDTALETR